MDLTTIVGLVLGIASLLTAFVMEGGSPAALFGLSAGIIVFGGTIEMTHSRAVELIFTPKADRSNTCVREY